MIQARTLTWAACYNIRDLGGLPTSTGQVTRLGAIVRSDLPARLTAEGQQCLLDYGIRTILDLRKPHQVVQEPSLFMQPDTDPATPHYINISFENHASTVDEQIAQAGQDRVQVYALMLAHNQPQVRQILQSVAEARPGGILIHCSAGKDRTGLISALLLALAGVPDAVIAEDYALSQAQLWPLYEKLVAEAGGEERVGWWLKPVATPATMQAVLTHLRNDYGGAVGYLRQSGLSKLVISQLRERLLPESTLESECS